MNPAFILIVAIVLIALWFLLSALYKPIGKLFGKIYDDAIKELTEEDEEKTGE